MAFASQHVLLTIEGVFGETAGSPFEQWMTTLRVLPAPTAPFEDELIGFLADVEPFVSTYHADNDVRAGTACWLTALSAVVLGTDGKYVGGDLQDTTRAFLTTPLAGASTTNTPFSTCLVRSLRTARGRGRASNGRMYYPMTGPATTPANMGRIATTTAAGIATKTATLLDGINTAANANLGTGTGVAVMSAVGAGLSASVTHVRVGCKVDHMESRERDIPEAYQSADLS